MYYLSHAEIYRASSPKNPGLFLCPYIGGGSTSKEDLQAR